MAVLAQSADRLEVARVTWRKRGFADWWGEMRSTVTAEDDEPSFAYHLPATNSSSCTDDTWKPTTVYERRPAGPHLFWTGTEMIVWGGSTLRAPVFYAPATDSWRKGSDTGAPLGYVGSAVWTGTELMAWGGSSDGSSVSNQGGGRYDPASNSWVAMRPLSEAPEARSGHTTVWTGVEMVMWGGAGRPVYQVRPLDSGAVYRPVMDLWTATATSNVPAARYYGSAVWTGTEMIVWSGLDASGVRLTSGGRYNPATDSWLALLEAGSPAGRISHTAVWTGTEMVVWGGDDNTGGRFNPATNTWSPTSTLRSRPSTWVRTPSRTRPPSAAGEARRTTTRRTTPRASRRR